MPMLLLTFHSVVALFDGTGQKARLLFETLVGFSSGTLDAQGARWRRRVGHWVQGYLALHDSFYQTWYSSPTLLCLYQPSASSSKKRQRRDFVVFDGESFVLCWVGLLMMGQSPLRTKQSLPLIVQRKLLAGSDFQVAPYATNFQNVNFLVNFTSTFIIKFCLLTP